MNIILRVSFTFLPKGGEGAKWDCVQLLRGGGEGKYVSVYKACGKLGVQGHAPPGNFDLDLLIDAGSPYEQAPYHQ